MRLDHVTISIWILFLDIIEEKLDFSFPVDYEHLIFNPLSGVGHYTVHGTLTFLKSLTPRRVPRRVATYAPLCPLITQKISPKTVKISALKAGLPFIFESKFQYIQVHFQVYFPVFKYM